MSGIIKGFDVVDSDSGSNHSDHDNENDDDDVAPDEDRLNSFFSSCPIDFASEKTNNNSSTTSSQSGSSSHFSMIQQVGSSSFGVDDDGDVDDTVEPKLRKRSATLITRKVSLLANVSASVQTDENQKSAAKLRSSNSSPFGSSCGLSKIFEGSFRGGDSGSRHAPQPASGAALSARQHSPPSPECTELARARAIRHQLALAEERKLEHQRLLARQDEAAARRDQKAKTALIVLEHMWRTLLVVARFAKCLKDPRNSRGGGQAVEVVRKITRNMRLKQLAAMPRPTIAHLKADKLLALFPEHHLAKFSRRMVPKYFFSGESVMCQNCVEDETFVLCKGTVDVVVSRVVVSTISNPGTVLGSMGMISGEPRTASIIAKTNCVFWMGNRLGFDVFSTHTTAATKFITEQRNANFRKVHQAMLTANSLAGYPLMSGISADGLRILCECGEPLIAKKKRATILAPTDTLASTSLLLLAGKVTLVLRRSHAQNPDKVAEALAWAADFPRGQKNFLRPIFLKRDSPVAPEPTSPKANATTAPVAVPGGGAEQSLPAVSFPFQIANLLKFLKFQTDHGLQFANDEKDDDDGSDDDDSEDGAYRCSWQSDNEEEVDVPEETKIDANDDDNHFFNDSLDCIPIAEMTAPCFINCAPMAIRKWVGIGVLTKSSGVEALVLRRERVFESLPVEDVSQLSSNAFKTNYKLIKAPGTDQLPRIFCEAQRFGSVLQFLQRLPLHLLRTTPFSVPEGSRLEFTSKREQHQRCYIVTKGELLLDGSSSTSSSQQQQPLLWPQFPIVFFGTDDRVVTCRTHVDGVCFRRSALLKLLNRGIREHDRRKVFISSMEGHYFSLTMQSPKAIADETNLLDTSWFTSSRQVSNAPAVAPPRSKVDPRGAVSGAPPATDIVNDDRPGSPRRNTSASVSVSMPTYPSVLNSSPSGATVRNERSGTDRRDMQRPVAEPHDESDNSLSLSLMDRSSRTQPIIMLPQYIAVNERNAGQVDAASPTRRSSSLVPTPPSASCCWSPNTSSRRIVTTSSSHVTSPALPPSIGRRGDLSSERLPSPLHSVTSPAHELHEPSPRLDAAVAPPNPRSVLLQLLEKVMTASEQVIVRNCPPATKVVPSSIVVAQQHASPLSQQAPGRQSLRSAQSRSSQLPPPPPPAAHGDSRKERYLPTLHQCPSRQTVRDRRVASALRSARRDDVSSAHAISSSIPLNDSVRARIESSRPNSSRSPPQYI